MKLAAVKGFRDIQAGEVLARRAVLEASCKVLENYGFEELELPLLERVELFQRTVGDYHVVNVGSVGAAPEGQIAHYTVLTPKMSGADILQDWVSYEEQPEAS